MNTVPPIEVDLRSDTVTRPTSEMRQAMRDAPVGDDVYGEDPTILALEREVAAGFGHEAALFFPSGCMANLAGLMCHAEPGSEAICEAAGHAFNFEQSSAARVAGVQLVPVSADDGVLRASAVARVMRPAGDAHLSPTRVVIAENTHNMRGGRVWPLEELEGLSRLCRERGVALHLDGARIFNAAAAQKVELARYGALVDTVMCCMSKGLGAPVGSLLVGSRATIERAHRVRKLLGGGMRQAGVLAAAALVTWRGDWRSMLLRDHARAQAIGAWIAQEGRAELLSPVETNIVRFRPKGATGAATDELARRLAARGVGCHAIGGEFVRWVVHRDVPADVVERACAALAQAL